MSFEDDKKYAPRATESDEPQDILPTSLLAAVIAHYEEKVKNKACDCCGTDIWTPLLHGSMQNDYITMMSAFSLPNKRPRTWATMGFVCSNCHYVRWFAIQPIIREWIDKGGQW